MAQEFFSRKIGSVRRAFRQELEGRIASFEITLAQFQVLRRLWDRDNLGTLQLAKETGLDTGTITGVVDRLEHKGLVRRERNAHDRRSVQVMLTPSGAELQEPLYGLLNEVNEMALEGVTEQERAEMMRLLNLMLDNLANRGSHKTEARPEWRDGRSPQAQPLFVPSPK